MEKLPLNSDFSDMLSALNGSGCDYLLVGAYAVAIHAVPRFTSDIDFWVRPSPDNAKRVMAALKAYGAPLFDLCEADLVRRGLIFQIGADPNCIHLMTSVSGLEFSSAWTRRVTCKLFGQDVPLPSLDDLIRNKEASGRDKDKFDLIWLREKKAQS